MPTKRDVRETVRFCFHLKKIESWKSCLLAETYLNYVTSNLTWEYLFGHTKDGDSDLNDKEYPGEPKKFADAELEALVDADQSKMLNDLSYFYANDSISRKFIFLRIGAQKYGKALLHVMNAASTTKKERNFILYCRFVWKCDTLRYS